MVNNALVVYWSVRNGNIELWLNSPYPHMSCYRSSTGTPLDTDSSNFQRRLHRYGCIRHCSCRIHLHLKKTMVLGKKVIAHHVSPFSAKWNPVIWHILHWSLFLLVNTPKWLTAWENLVESGWPTDLLDDGHDARFALISWHTSQGANKTSSRDYNKHLSHTCDLNVWLSCKIEWLRKLLPFFFFMKTSR